jgi:1-acyl-sn-glycerol-3-phosphate acyltransferase
VDQLDALTGINLEDLFQSLGITRGRRWLTPFFRPAARNFARQLVEFDRRVGADGLPAGAEWLLKRFVGSLEVAGPEHVPNQGPALILSNHPGMADTAALFVAIARPDLKIMAADRPFLRAIPNTARQLIFLSDDPAQRMGAVREAARALRNGHAVLTFPAGKIEPDPAVRPGMRDSLATWSESVSVLVRRTPEAQVLPAIVSGVLSPAAQHHPLTCLRRKQADRERLGATLQITIPAYRHVPARIAFGRPRRAGDLLDAHADPRALITAVTAEADRMITHPPTTWVRVTTGGVQW